MGDRERFLRASVIYRDTLTDHDYEEAILALHQAMRQADLLRVGCAICEDTGHTAEQCHHNPLLLARKWVAATSIYRAITAAISR